jgi:glycosyltransferase involved in cell wall biosynthesis
LDLANIFCCLFSFGQTKPIITIHTNLTTEYTQGKKKNSIYPNLSKLLYKIPSKFIAVSKGVANDFAYRTNVQREKIQVIYNPVYKPYNSGTQAYSLQVFKDLQIKNEKFIISVGRIVEQKDLFTLIKAFSIVREKIDIPLVILGEGPQKKELQNYIEALSLTEHVFLLGFVENPQYYMKEASVFVLSSKWEGLPTVLIEVLGVGTSIVSTNCPSGPAEILENGKYGRLVPVEDPGKMAEAIIETLKDPTEPEVLIDRARDFSVSKIANEYLQYIES